MPRRPPTLDALIDAATAAKKLGVCKRTIQRWAKAGRITAHRVSHKVVRYDALEIAEMVTKS